MKKLKRLFSYRRSSQPRDSLRTAASPTSKEKTHASQEKTSQPMTLEQLPHDIRHQILLAMDSIPNLDALIHSSPCYFRQYYPQRKFWLWRCFWLETGPVFVDAYTANLCSSMSFRRKRSKRKVQKFITEYNTRRSDVGDKLPESSSEWEMRQMMMFHCTIMRPLLNRYVAWTSANLPSLSDPEQPSRTEEIRIFRGLYRLHICCQLFGFSEYDRGYGSRAPKAIGIFLSNFEPWEREEVLCMNTFSLSMIDSAFEAVAKDFHPDNPRFQKEQDGHPITPEGAFDAEDLYDRERYKAGIASMGMYLLGSICKPPDHATLIQTISDNLVSMVTGWMNERRYSFERDIICLDNYSERDRAQDRRDPMPFVGDRVDSPPLAWVTVWLETYSNIFGEEIPEEMRYWGFVMWDAQRLKASGALEAIDELWKDLQQDFRDMFVDPREYHWIEYDHLQVASV